MLKLIILVLSLCCVARSASIAQLNEHKENAIISEKNLNICSTQECNKTSAYISSLLDESVEPCDDFYQFACGTFLKRDLPSDKKEYSIFDTVQQNVYDQLNSVLSEPIQANDSKAIALAKTYFGSCMNKEAVEEQGIEPLLEKIERFGGWPVVKGDSWSAENFDWIKLLKKLSEEGFGTNQIIRFERTVGLDNSTRYIIYIDRPDLNLKRSFLNRLRTPYLSYMVNVAVMMGANRSQAEIEMNNTLSFEIQLLNASIPSKSITFKDLYNTMSFRELQVKYPYLNWLEYARTLMPSNITIDEDEPVAVSLFDYFDRLEGILQNMDKRTIANYLIWRAIFTISKYMNKNMLDLNLKFSETLNGKNKPQPQHIECIAYTTNALPMPVGELYVRNFFDDESKTKADELVNTIRTEFAHLLSNIDWMDNETKETAIEKAKFMDSFVAYPNASYNNDFNLDHFYEGLELCADNFAENFLRISHFDSSKKLINLHKPIESPSFTIREKTALVNAFYAPRANSVYITAALLQLPFFDAKRPSFINYAKIGQFIGHEITHGFDDGGRIFNRFGEIMNWWRNDTNEQYTSKSECFEEQFSAYETADGDKINGYTTLDENIADSGGIKVAYNAYQHFVDRNGPEDLLPGLNYTQKQLFWISTAQTWCSITDPVYLRTFLATDAHAPHSFRVRGMLSNMPNFASDFKCKPNTPMNPNKRCELW